jgi:mono/diheme cytochrome c family protein
MKRLLPVLALAAFVAGLSPHQAGGQQTATSPEAQKALLNQYCVTCHSQKLKTGGLVIETLDLANAGHDAETWEKVVRKVRTGMMPPAGARRPERAALDAFAAGLEASLDRAAEREPNPGTTLLHRMNRVEYANAIRDLLTVDIDPAAYLPADDSDNGFDNVAEALGISPALMERYVGAAAKISRVAIGDPGISPLATTYKVHGDLTQTDTIDGAPPGTRGGIVVHHNFPLDGEYDLKVSLLKVGFGPIFAGQADGEQLEVSVNGQRVKLFDLDPVPFYYMRARGTSGGVAQGGAPGGGQAGRGGPVAVGKAATKTPAPQDPEGPPVEERVTMTQNAHLDLRLRMKAGPQTILVTFLKRTSAVVDDLVLKPSATTRDVNVGVQYGYTSVPHLAAVDIVGPYNPTGSGDTPSRRRIFTCRPSLQSKDQQDQELKCAKQIIGTLARRAYRRPVTDTDLEPLLSFYQTTRNGSKGTFDTGIEMALRRILADPEFVFRFERDPANVKDGALYRISGVELASRLSFFLWSSIPDDELLNLASQGKLTDRAVLEQQTRRMLKDPRARSLVNNFAGQWLYLRELKNSIPDANSYPDFDDNLRQAFQRETELLFQSTVDEDRNVLDLLNADYTFVNERLARHYGIPNVYGPDFRRVKVDEQRRGLLGQGSMLLVTSNANRTSPVQRGKWILENILGSPPPLPPPNVPPLKESAAGAVDQPVRERMEEHRSNPVCSACHKIMDPIGLSLENFDGVGKWRTVDSGFKIDASGQLVDGTKIDGPASLRKALAGNYGDAFIRTLAEKLLTYGVGRELHYYDMPVVRAITRDAARSDNRFSSLVLGIVNSAPFQMRMKAAGSPVAQLRRPQP